MLRRCRRRAGREQFLGFTNQIETAGDADQVFLGHGSIGDANSTRNADQRATLRQYLEIQRKMILRGPGANMRAQKRYAQTPE